MAKKNEISNQKTIITTILAMAVLISFQCRHTEQLTQNIK